jgi:hypothetical protein
MPRAKDAISSSMHLLSFETWEDAEQARAEVARAV